MTATTEPTTRTLAVPGATLAYDLRAGASREGGFGPGMARFFGVVSHQRPFKLREVLSGI